MRAKLVAIAILIATIAPYMTGCAAAVSQPATSPTSYWEPTGRLRWQWQLDGTVDTAIPADVYDIDGFDSSAALVHQLHTLGRHVICYIDVGTWENWRPDAGQFPTYVLGKADAGWPGERWLDIRQIPTLAPMLEKRLQMCKAKGFDAVEPDNIDGYTNDTGFPLTYANQLTFNRWIAAQAHRLGLSIGLKNDPDQVPDLLSSFDWALTEDCFAEGWCKEDSPFIRAGKSVFAAEYTDTGMTLDAFCPQARSLGFSAILKQRDLGAWIESC